MPLLCIPIVKRFLGVKNGPKMALIRGNGGRNIRFYVRDPEKAHSCAEPRVLAYFASKSVERPRLLRSELQEPEKREKTSRVNTFGAYKVTHARKLNPWADRDELLHRCRGPRHNHLCQLL